MFLVLIFIRCWVDPRAMVRSEGNMSLKNPVTPPGIDPGTVRIVAQREYIFRMNIRYHKWVRLMNMLCIPRISFNILLAVCCVIILSKSPTWRAILYCVFILTLYTFRAHCAHHQERQTVSIQPLVSVTVYRWPCRVQVGSKLLIVCLRWMRFSVLLLSCKANARV
jgi:hypothetical protein